MGLGDGVERVGGHRTGVGDRAGLGALEGLHVRGGLVRESEGMSARSRQAAAEEAVWRRQARRQGVRSQQKLAGGDQRRVEGKREWGSEAPPLTGCVTMGRSLHPHTPREQEPQPMVGTHVCPGMVRLVPTTTPARGLAWTSCNRYLHPSLFPGHEILLSCWSGE